jgi:hypothetical protein
MSRAPLDNFDPFDEVLSTLNNKAFLENYGSNFSSMKEAYLAERNYATGGIASISGLLETVLFQQAFSNLLIASKLKYIFSGARGCRNADNAIGLAYFARGALEHVSTYAYGVNQCQSAVARLTGQNSPTKAVETLKDLSQAFNILYYGSGDRNAAPRGQGRPIHIHKAIDALDEYFGKISEGSKSKPDSTAGPEHNYLFHESLSVEQAEAKFGIPLKSFSARTLVRADYDFLCDFVHPNFGSNFLVSEGTIAEGLIDTPNEHVQELAILFTKKCLRYWLYYRELLRFDLRVHIECSSWLQRSHKHGAKAARVFAKRPLKYDGDGRTVETSYSFPRARDKLEEFDMFGALLNHLGISDYEREIVHANSHRIVDRVKSRDGLTFFVKFQKLDLP